MPRMPLETIVRQSKPAFKPAQPSLRRPPPSIKPKQEAPVKSGPVKSIDDDLLTLPPAESFGDEALQGEVIDGRSDISSRIESTASSFAEEVANLRKLLGGSEGTVEQGMLSMVRAMLASTIEMLPIAEGQYKKYKNERAAYAFSTLVNQARELGNDLRTMQDLEGQVIHILTSILQPAFTQVMQHMINEVYAARTEIGRSVRDPRSQEVVQNALNTLLRAHAGYLQDMGGKVQSQLRDYLVEKK